MNRFLPEWKPAIRPWLRWLLLWASLVPTFRDAALTTLLLAKPTPHNVNHDSDRFSMFNKKLDIAAQACRGRRTRMFTYVPQANPSAWTAAVVVATMLVGSARAGEGVPNFSPDNRTRWIAGDPNGRIPIGDDYLPQPPGAGPGPVVSDKDHPYIDNRVARLTGKQPNNRVADLSNPILQPWARESLRKLKVT